MYTSINIDAAVEHIKNIVDNIRCAVCDKADGTRMRYSCGHTSCEECVVVAADCSVCLTPPLNAARQPVVDKIFTQSAENAVNLLNVFQKEFHIDVYKRQRISEQLKVEKEIFPDCIQAPAKYFNKRKSFKNIKSNKENKLSQIPGEEVSTIWDQTMEQSSGNVEQWLKKYVRKPFADLNSNEEILRRDSSAIKKQNAFLTENATVQKSNRKRAHTKTALSVVKNQTLIDNHLTPVKKKKTKNHKKKPVGENSICVRSDTSRYLNTGNNTKATDIDESGIGMEDEAVIVINDSPSIRVDKDKNAWLAVYEAENKKPDDSVSTVGSKSNELWWEQGHNEKAVEAKPELSTKVPFYLKGYLSEKCIDCSFNSNIDKSDTLIVEPDKDVSITVENKNFTAIIKVTSIENTKAEINSKQSVQVQTDIFESEIVNKGITSDNLNLNLDNNEEFVNQMSTCISQSQDMFNDDGKMHDVDVVNKKIKSVNKTHNVIIEESDSDGDSEPSVSLEVTADIHRSCNEMDYGILVDIENLGEHSKRPRRAARGFTPTSTDSSEKENFNPNRKKKAPSSKKKPMKK